MFHKHLFLEVPGKRFYKDDIGVIPDSKENFIIFNIKINVELAGVTNKNGKKIQKKYSAEIHTELQIYVI